MKNKYFVAFMIAVLMLASMGCAKGEEGENGMQPIIIEPIGETDQREDGTEAEGQSSEDGTDEAEEQADEVKDQVEATKTETPVSAEDVKTSQGEDFDPVNEAYYSVLEKLYKTYTLPDGTQLGYDEITDLSWNKFAIYDIDGDGREELIVLWTTTYTAGMAGIVYGFDSASGTVKEELYEYPSQTFYDNGVVKAELSHNHGMAGEIEDFWPYTFYRYDKNSDTYVVAAEVDAWNKAYYETDYNDKPFPDELDADGDGILYKVIAGEDEKLIDLEEYKKWCESIIGGAQKVEIPFVEMTEGNLKVK